MEANPEDVAVEAVEAWAAGGVNRLSLGVQSIDDAKLACLERAHRAEDVQRCVEIVRRRIPNFSVDLIFGVPHEALRTWQTDLDFAIQAQAPHVSTYGLTFEKGTRFWNSRQRADLTPTEEELERRMYETAIDTLTGAGLEHYEVSNFAMAGGRCRHNEKYWLGNEYYAVGPGAARYLDGRREVNHRSPFTYLKKVLAGQSAVAEWETLDATDRARERLVFGLRRLEGVDADQFALETGIRLKELAEAPLASFVDQGFVRWDDRRIRLTREGLMISDALWPYLLSS
jgi:oxygen-independent coproporphyrinogen-3 oxidase